jgi:hypothetical protein
MVAKTELQSGNAHHDIRIHSATNTEERASAGATHSHTAASKEPPSPMQANVAESGRHTHPCCTMNNAPEQQVVTRPCTLPQECPKHLQCESKRVQRPGIGREKKLLRDVKGDGISEKHVDMDVAVCGSSPWEWRGVKAWMQDAGMDKPSCCLLWVLCCPCLCIFTLVALFKYAMHVEKDKYRESFRGKDASLYKDTSASIP